LSHEHPENAPRLASTFFSNSDPRYLPLIPVFNFSLRSVCVPALEKRNHPSPQSRVQRFPHVAGPFRRLSGQGVLSFFPTQSFLLIWKNFPFFPVGDLPEDKSFLVIQTASPFPQVILIAPPYSIGSFFQDPVLIFPPFRGAFFLLVFQPFFLGGGYQGFSLKFLVFPPKVSPCLGRKWPYSTPRPQGFFFLK